MSCVSSQSRLCRKSTWITLMLASFYVSLASVRIIFIKMSSNEENLYDYLPVTVNVCAELVKFIVCFLLALKLFFIEERKSCREVFAVNRDSVLDLLKWSVPGLLYFIDNLLQFYVIANFQPAIASLLSNFVIITTSILFRVVLKRKLSRIQWVVIVILFLSIISLSNQSQDPASLTRHNKHHDVNHALGPAHACGSMVTVHSHLNTTRGLLPQTSPGSPPPRFTLGHLLVLISCFISASANIYNEKIFKEGNGLQDSIYVQNSKLYAFGILFNSLTMLVNGAYRRRIAACGFFHGYNQFSALLIFLTALFGLVTALILKFRDNMFHVMSGQVTTVVMVTSSLLFFHFQPGLDFFLQAPIVLLSIYIYHAASRPQDKVKVEDDHRVAAAATNGTVLSDQVGLLSAYDDEELQTEESQL